MDYPDLQAYQQKLLDQALTEALKRNEEEFKTWNEYRKRHKKVIEGLEVFPLEVSVNCMVPLGKRALMKGKLTHTNEILVCLGEGYFVKYSAARAIALCNRRIQHAEETIQKLEAERNLYEMKQFVPLEYDVFGKDERKDLAEYWDEKSLEDWRVQHRQREKQYREKLSKICEEEKAKETEKEKESDISAEEQLFRRLDELELEEELTDELNRLEEDDSQEDGEYYESAEEESSSEEVTIEELQKELQKLKDIRMHKGTNNVEEIVEKTIENTVEKTSHNIVEIADTTENNTVQKVSCDTTGAASTTDLNNTLPLKAETAPESTTSADKTETKQKKRSVTFALSTDEAEGAFNARNNDIGAQSCKYENEDEIFRIEFTHSDNVPRVAETSDKVQTPADIYEVFSKPKSVLKKTPYSTAYNQNLPTVHDLEIEEEEEDTEEECNKVSAYKTIVRDIQERKVEVPMQPPQEREKKQFVSKFKKERAGLKK